MTLEQLVVLDAIVTQGTFRGAAEQLNKAQSAVSHMLKKLEDELGLELLSRAGYRPVLTTQGEVFYRHATRVLRRVQDLKSIAKNLKSHHEAEVQMSITAAFPLKPLLGLIGEMTEAYPATHVRLSRDNMGGPLESLLSGEAQIIISTLDDVPLELVEAVPVQAIKILPVASPDYPPARSSHLKTTLEMQNHVQVVVADNSSSQKQSRGLLPGGLRWTVSDFATKKEILLAGMGWGGMPEHLIQDELRRGKLVPLDVEEYPPVQVMHHLMRRRDLEAGIVAQAIWERILKTRGDTTEFSG